MKMKNNSRKSFLFSALLIMIFTCTGICRDIPDSGLSATEGSCAEIKCYSEVGLARVSKAKWFWIKDSVWDAASKDYVNITYVYSSNQQDVSSDFAGRVTYIGTVPPWNRGSTCSIKICNLRKTDSGRYRFRITEPKHSTVDTTLTVTENECPITFTGPPELKEFQTTSLICSTPRSCPSYPQIQGRQALTKSQVNTNDTKISNVTFNATWQDNGKQLTCQEVNNKDQHLVKKFNLTVKYAPKDVMATVSPTTVKEGQQATWTCSAKGNPTPSFKWFKNGVALPSKDAQWTITEARTEDGGRYSCEAHNIYGTVASQLLVVDVTYPPEVEVKNISPVSKEKEGDEMILECVVKRSNPYPFRYRWYKNNTDLTHSGSWYRKTLEQRDNGFYACAADNSAGSSRSSQSVKIHVQYGPRRPNIQPIENKVKVGGSLTMQCETTAEPPPTSYTWYRHTRGTHVIPSMSGKALYLSKLKRGDEACYTCSATNIIKTGESSDEACIEVLYPPTNLQLLMDTEVLENTLVTISCTVESLPISELRLAAPLPSGLFPPLMERSNVLNHTFTATPAHKGTYTCSATNGEGSRQIKLQELVVRYSPRDVRIEAPAGLAREENSELTLHCAANASPEPSFTWWKVTPKGPERQLQGNRSLVFNSLRVSDSGQYRCSASNHLATKQSELADVKVEYAPKLTLIFKAAELQHPDGRSSVMLSCSSNCFPPANQYTWFKRVKNDPETTGTRVSSHQNFTVYSDSPGYYSCKTKNKMGERSSDSVPLFVEGSFIKGLRYSLLFLFILILLIIAIVTYRQRRLKSGQGSSKTTSLRFGFLNAGSNARTRLREPAHASHDGDELSYTQPTPQRAHRRPDVTPMSELTVYSTVNLPATNLGTSTQKPTHQGGSNGTADSLNYASLHFDKRQKTQEPKAEGNVVYAKVANKKRKEKPEDDYTNIVAAPALKSKVYSWDSDSSEEETGLNYTQVTFPTKAEHARRKKDSSSSEKEETNYSEIKF